MKMFKGFNKDMTCRGFKFEEGKTYHEDKAKLCESGFHACEMPLNCFNYYKPSTSEYHSVDLDEVTEERQGDTKRCGKTIKIGAKLGIRDLVKAQLEFVFEKVEKEKAATSGNGSSAATSGTGSSAATSGYKSSAATSGTGSSAATSGTESSAATSNKNGIALACGKNAKAKGVIGSHIVVTEWDDKEENILSVCCGKVDGETLKADTWYTVKDGKFVEVDE